MNTRITHSRIIFGSLVVGAALAATLAMYVLAPMPFGDSISYLEAMRVMLGGEPPVDFTPNRLLTTPLGLASVLASGVLFGVLPGWLILNTAYFVALVLASFYVLRTLFEENRVALLGTLFIAGNYAVLVFGLGYLMDIGGWAFYLLSLLGVSVYLIRNSERALLAASVAVGVGALYKEYALLGSVAIAVALLARAAQGQRRAWFLMLVTALIALLPLTVVHIVVYQLYGYTYLEWMRFNADMYVYVSRTAEYVKALGSLLHLLAPCAIVGAYFLGRDTIERGRVAFSDPRILAMSAVVLSGVPAFLWSGITQRVLFVLVPGAAVLACIVFARFPRLFWGFMILACAYIALNLHMEVLLDAVNLPL